MPPLVEWSDVFDTDGNRMVRICGGLYPVDIVVQIVQQSVALLATQGARD